MGYPEFQNVKEILGIVHDINKNVHSSRFGISNDLDKAKILELQLADKFTRVFAKIPEKPKVNSQLGSHIRKLIEQEIRGLTAAIRYYNYEGAFHFKWKDWWQDQIVEPYYLQGASVAWIVAHHDQPERTVYRVKDEKIVLPLWEILNERFILPAEGEVRPARSEDLTKIRLLEAKIFTEGNRWGEGSGELEDAFARYPGGFWVYDVSSTILGFVIYMPVNEKFLSFCLNESEKDMEDWDVFEHILTGDQFQKSPRGIILIESLCHLEDPRGTQIGEALLLKLIDQLLTMSNLDRLATIIVSDDGASLITGIKTLLENPFTRVGSLKCNTVESKQRPWGGLMRDFYLFQFNRL